MPVRRNSGGTQTIVTAARRRSGSSWVNLTFWRRRASGAWVDMLAMIVSISPASLRDQRNNGSRSCSFSASVISGSGNYSYSWYFVDGNILATIANANTASCSFTVSGTNIERWGTLQVRVTDNVTGQQVTKDASVWIQFGTPM